MLPLEIESQMLKFNILLRKLLQVPRIVLPRVPLYGARPLIVTVVKPLALEAEFKPRQNEEKNNQTENVLKVVRRQ